MNIPTRVLILYYIFTLFLGFPVWGSRHNPFNMGEFPKIGSHFGSSRELLSDWLDFLGFRVYRV